MKVRRSSTFYRLEKSIGDGFIDVYEFHTVVNGNRYIARHEERDGTTRGIYKNERTNKEIGNSRYRQLLERGYKFAGKYEMDIYGHKEPLEK